MEKRARNCKIRRERLILVLALYVGIGLIPLSFVNYRANKAKAKLAHNLLEEHSDYPKNVKAILRKAAKNPKYAGRNIHVWTDFSYLPFDTYVGGDDEWYEEAVLVIPNTGGDIAETIIVDGKLRVLLWTVSLTWWIIPWICYFTERRQKR